MRESAVDGGIRTGTNGGVILGVGVVMGDRTDHHAEVLHDLEGEEEGYTPEGRGHRCKSEADIAAVEQPLLDQGTDTVGDKDCKLKLEALLQARGGGEDGLHRLSPAARPLYTQAYNTVGRGIGASGSTSTVYFLPYQVRLVFFLVTKAPFSGSPEREPSRAGFGVGGKIPKTELKREPVGDWNGLAGWAEWPETEFEAVPVPSLTTGGRDRHRSLMRRSSKS